MESFEEILRVGGKANSLGRSAEIIDVVIADKSLLEDLYSCLFSEDAWVRMRAADVLEKVCRIHPDWLVPYVDRLIKDFCGSTQPSILWHLAQIFRQVQLIDSQTSAVIKWLKQILSKPDADWIVAANAMDTLIYFMNLEQISKPEARKLVDIQLHHKSKSVVRRACKIINEMFE